MTINDPRDDPKYRVGAKNFLAEFEQKDTGISARAVNELHGKSDVDSSSLAQHHTLGTKHDQASFGDHDHDGKNSLKLLTGTTITGSRGGNAAVASIIDALEKLGATDATTA